jgi:hypothetical protein
LASLNAERNVHQGWASGPRLRFVVVRNADRGQRDVERSARRRGRRFAGRGTEKRGRWDADGNDPEKRLPDGCERVPEKRLRTAVGR